MRLFLYAKFNTCKNLCRWGYLNNVRLIISLVKWKTSKKTNCLKILMIQKFSLLKDFLCRIKRYTFFKILVSRTMPPPIKFPQHEMIQSNHFVTLLMARHFTRVPVLCNLFIFVSPNLVTRNLVSFHLFFCLCCDPILWRNLFERFYLQLKISSVLHFLLVYLEASYS